MIDKKTICYEVLIFDYISSIGGYRATPLATRIFYDEETAIDFARTTLNAKREVPIKIEIRQLSRLINWQ